ncbi:hypothetical protein TNCV_4087111 [Trichonephila clavipes]|nr:hypothetical protein TNCV_4087111 [Trichonephila clavipes]
MEPSRKSPSVEHHLLKFCDSFRFFIVKTPDTFTNVSPFLIEKAFTSSIGEVKSIRKMRSGDLFLEASSAKTGDRPYKSAKARSFRRYRGSSYYFEFFARCHFTSGFSQCVD